VANQTVALNISKKVGGRWTFRSVPRNKDKKPKWGSLSRRLAGSDASDPMLAIACTLANQMRAGKKPWLAVIGEAMVPSTTLPDSREPSFQKLLQSIDPIYEGSCTP
jgi:hypothetical protein